MVSYVDSGMSNPRKRLRRRERSTPYPELRSRRHFRAGRRAPAPTEPVGNFSHGLGAFPVIVTARPPAGAHFGGWREDVKSRKGRRSVWSAPCEAPEREQKNYLIFFD